jgi:hypothetical protein
VVVAAAAESTGAIRTLDGVQFILSIFPSGPVGWLGLGCLATRRDAYTSAAVCISGLKRREQVPIPPLDLEANGTDGVHFLERAIQVAYSGRRSGSRRRSRCRSGSSSKIKDFSPAVPLERHPSRPEPLSSCHSRVSQYSLIVLPHIERHFPISHVPLPSSPTSSLALSPP